MLNKDSMLALSSKKNISSRVTETVDSEMTFLWLAGAFEFKFLLPKVILHDSYASIGTRFNKYQDKSGIVVSTISCRLIKCGPRIKACILDCRK